MVTAIFGGTFDPVHNGHLHVLSQIERYTDFEMVIMIPVCIPPHKVYTRHVTDEQRIKMLDLAITSWRQLHAGSTLKVGIDDCEIRSKGTSYMYDTVRDISHRYDIACNISVI
ncbi:MAG: adenylyltransferase/cytidyltransferase family protein, partial [Sphaerochaetaceae bacterium]|nr:adenylyltransferase/cytidyltransferase family protein [Sphaerochaetaceae bacterium]